MLQQEPLILSITVFVNVRNATECGLSFAERRVARIMVRWGVGVYRRQLQRTESGRASTLYWAGVSRGYVVTLLEEMMLSFCENDAVWRQFSFIFSARNEFTV